MISFPFAPSARRYFTNVVGLIWVLRIRAVGELSIEVNPPRMQRIQSEGGEGKAGIFGVGRDREMGLVSRSCLPPEAGLG